MLCVNPPHFLKTLLGLNSCRIAVACAEPVEPKCFKETHTSPGVLMHGVTSAPSSPEIVCMEQCESRWGREKGESMQDMERAEHKVTQPKEPPLELWHKEQSPLSNARWNNRKNDVLYDREVRLMTTEQLLGWPPLRSASAEHEQFPGASQSQAGEWVWKTCTLLASLSLTHQPVITPYSPSLGRIIHCRSWPS